MNKENFYLVIREKLFVIIKGGQEILIYIRILIRFRFVDRKFLFVYNDIFINSVIEIKFKYDVSKMEINDNLIYQKYCDRIFYKGEKD